MLDQGRQHVDEPVGRAGRGQHVGGGLFDQGGQAGTLILEPSLEEQAGLLGWPNNHVYRLAPAHCCRPLEAYRPLPPPNTHARTHTGTR